MYLFHEEPVKVMQDQFPKFTHKTSQLCVVNLGITKISGSTETQVFAQSANQMSGKYYFSPASSQRYKK